jgi:Protein of unknown function (DUF3617)
MIDSQPWRLKSAMRHPLHAFSIAALCVVAGAPARALDLPARKVGLWEVKMAFEGRNLPPQVVQQCIDAATDKMMSAFGSNLSQGMCSKQDVQKVGNTLVIDSVCQIAGMTTTSHGVVSGDFNSSYTVKMTSTRTGGPAIPGMPADGKSDMTIEAKWLSACKPDQKPGDMIMADGRKINIVDVQIMMPPNMRGAGQKK